MNLRTFATPLIIGAFLTSAVTGLLLFFESAVGFNKPAHEWVGLATVLGATLHVTTNWAAFKTYWSKTKPASLVVISLFIAFLALSFYAPGQKKRGPPPQRLALSALSRAPLTTLALVVNKPVDEVVGSLVKAGFKVSGPDQTLDQVAGAEREDQGRAMGAIFSSSKPE